jgi:hypothetical protein
LNYCRERAGGKKVRVAEKGKYLFGDLFHTGQLYLLQQHLDGNHHRCVLEPRRPKISVRNILDVQPGLLQKVRTSL